MTVLQRLAVWSRMDLQLGLTICGISASTAWKSVTALCDLFIEGIDAIEPVEQPPHRRQHDRDVETVWLPIEVGS